MSSYGLPAVEAADRFGIFVQRCGYSSMALHGLRDAVSREGHTASPSAVCAVWQLWQPGTAAHLAR